VNFRVDKRLREMAEALRKFAPARGTEKEEK
jgi:hypothetical protein